MGEVKEGLQDKTKRVAKSAIARMLEDICPEEPPYGAVENLFEMLKMAVLAVATAKLDEQAGKKRTFELHADISDDSVVTQLCGIDFDHVLPDLEGLAE